MRELVEMIRDAAEDMGDEVRFRDSYSGRGMYGRECVGVVGSEDSCMALVGEVIKRMHYEANPAVDFSQAVDLIMNISRDSMGRSMILYWPQLAPVEDREADDDGQPDEAQEWHDFDPDC